jgi:aerobic carbon-monoxide dehydrogenase medium subunit
MKAAPFAYHAPTTLDEALHLLATLEDAKLLAGGQSMMPMMNMRFLQPENVIDINRTEGLAYIREDSGTGMLRIGAMTRQKALMASEAVARACPMAPRALAHVGHFQTRSRGTIGGSLCHLDPAAELPLVMLLHDAVLTVRSQEGSREVPMAEWALAYMLPSLAPEELLVEIAVPLAPGWSGAGFIEFTRRHGDFAIASAGCLLALDADGVIRRAAVGLGGVAQTPVRVPEAEAALVGARPGEAAFAAAAAAASEVEALSDSYFSAGYRQRLAGVLVRRALTEAAAEAAR